MTKTTCYISSVQIQLHFISTSYGTRSTVTEHYHFLCSYARSNSQISEILVEIAYFHSYRLVTSTGIWRRIGALVYRKRRTANGSDLVVKLEVQCNREVDISLQNSLGRFIDLKLSVYGRLLLSFVGFVTQK